MQTALMIARRIKTTFVSVITCTFLLSPSSATGQAGYKPEQEEKDTITDDTDSLFRVIASPEGEEYFPKGRESFYTSYYHLAGLPSMQFKREEKDKVRFRLGILPSFAKPLFFTYTRDANGATIEVRRLKLLRDNHSLKPGDVELSGKVALGNDTSEHLELFAIDESVRTPFKGLTQLQRRMYGGLDGCMWILEVSTETDYTMEDIWSPESINNLEPEVLKEAKLPMVDVTGFIRFCEEILRVTDMKIPEYLPGH